MKTSLVFVLVLLDVFEGLGGGEVKRHLDLFSGYSQLLGSTGKYFSLFLFYAQESRAPKDAARSTTCYCPETLALGGDSQGHLNCSGHFCDMALS